MARFIQVGDYVRIIPLSGMIGKDIYVITSINQQPSIITIMIQSLNSPSEFRTIIIDTEGTKIQGSQVENEIIYGINQEELEQMSTTRDIGVSETSFRLTGVEPVDINILAQMDDDDLISACKIDRYTNQLCQKDALWKQKILMRYPRAEDFKDNTTNTWKDYYYRLTWIDLDQDGVNEAAINGYLDILSWIESLPDKIYPDQNGLKFSAENGHVKVLQWLADRRIHTTNNHPLRLAASSGKLEVLQWYVSLSPPHQKYPDQQVIATAAANANLNVLKWISSLPPPHGIYPNQSNVNVIVDNFRPGSIETLEWILTLPPPHNLLPDQRTITYPFIAENFEMLDWAARHNILPSGGNISNAAEGGNLNMLKWASRYDLYPIKSAVNRAGFYNRYNVVMWAATLPEPHTMYPPQRAIDIAVIKGRLDVLKWAASLPKEHRIFPNQYAIDKAKELGPNDIIEWLSTQPGPSGEYARKLLE